ncbi:hypothetical protein T492DRAFT_1148599 [Pavlovales sp. CCMP2436]|nr:hypothetical protein T492DRAFT_1148599 [Pavlovales sp. CCMP2436]|mmetsp:Transcript_38454/g.95176  ORF Transcript_38454/g.95176 Transcript_38454/m.95176 type:complete len:258 (+) Transcript_38454:170-943(+)
MTGASGSPLPLFWLMLSLATSFDTAPNTCAEGPQLPQAPGGNSTLVPRTLVSSAELKALIRTSGPVLAIFLQRRCPLSRAFWPAFTAASARFPHISFVAVDNEYEWSLNLQLGITGVPQVIFATGVQQGATSGELYARFFTIGDDLSLAEAQLAGFVAHHSGQLPLHPRAAMKRAVLPAEHTAPRAQSLAREYSGPTLKKGPGVLSLGAEGFPEPPAVHWRLLASLLIVAGWALQLVASVVLPRMPRLREAVNVWLS